MTTTLTIISSQRHRDNDIVASKRAGKDYQVFISPQFEIDDELYAVVLDGHHSHAAAKFDGVEPEYIECTQQQHDAIAILLIGDIQGFLEVVQDEDEFYDINTGVTVW